MLYSYEAKDAQGKRVSGTVEAPDERGAARHVQAEGYFLLRLSAAVPAAATATGGFSHQPGSYGDPRGLAAPLAPPPPLPLGRWLLTKLVYPFWTGVSLRDLAVMFRQFAALIDAGVPLQRAISTMKMQTHNAPLRRCLASIAKHINAGGTVSEAIAEFPWIFPEYQRASIIAGEAIGNLDVQFKRMATALEEEYTLRATIKREMFRPAVNLTAMFLFPPLVLLFMGQVHAYFMEAVFPLLVTIGIIFGAYVLCRLASSFRWFYDAVLSSLPAIGGTVRMIAFARFGRTLASMYSAGVNIVSALKYSIGASGNTYLGGRMEPIIPMLQAGQGITESFHHTGIFPPMVISMIGTGEESGNLDAMMDKMASFYEEEAKLKLHQLSTSLGAVTTIAVGIRILFVVVKFWTSFYSGVMQNTD